MFSCTTAQHIYCTNCTVCNWTVLTVITQKLLLHVQLHNSTSHLLYKYCTNCTGCNWTVLTVITQKLLLHVQMHNSTSHLLYKLYSLQLNCTYSNYTQAPATCSAAQQHTNCQSVVFWSAVLPVAIYCIFISRQTYPELDPSDKFSWLLTHCHKLTALLNTRLSASQGRFPLYGTFTFLRGTSPFSKIFSCVFKRRCSHWQKRLRRVSDPFRRQARMFDVAERVRTGLKLLDSDNVNSSYVTSTTRRVFAWNKGCLIILRNGWNLIELVRKCEEFYDMSNKKNSDSV